MPKIFPRITPMNANQMENFPATGAKNDHHPVWSKFRTVSFAPIRVIRGQLDRSD
jgi:hypothetical protein